MDARSGELFSYVDLEKRVPAKHPAAARAEAKAVIDPWNEQLVASRGHALVTDDPGRADRGNAVA
jgi:hypothetical protein